MIGTALGIAPWGLLRHRDGQERAAAADVAVLMSLVVFAGSAQLAALPLLAGGAPAWVRQRSGSEVLLRCAPGPWAAAADSGPR